MGLINIGKDNWQNKKFLRAQIRKKGVEVKKFFNRGQFLKLGYPECFGYFPKTSCVPELSLEVKELGKIAD